MSKIESKASASARVVPLWLSFVFLCIFIGGCVESCSLRGGLRSCAEAVRYALEEEAPK